MSVSILRGPAGAGKDSWIRSNYPAALLADATILWAAVSQAVRDPETGKYPERPATDPALALALYLKATAIRFAATRPEIELWTTTSNSSAESIQRIQEKISAGGGELGQVVTLDPGREVVEARLSDAVSGELSPECEEAVQRWYGGGA